MKKIFANLKMNMTYEQMIDYVSALPDNNNLIICPSYIFIPMFKRYNLGSQDVSIHGLGSYTGDIGIEQLSDFIKYAIIGHSERRMHYHESNEIISKKLNQLLKYDVCPILCIGEKEGENKESILREQLSILDGIDKTIFVAYEPVWAIGTGKIPTNEEIYATSNFIKNFVKENYNLDVQILYGGSVDDKNISSLNEISNIDGFLVGKASCDIDKLVSMLNQI